MSGVFSDKIIDIATQLDTAIPGSPTADSINERIKALDDEAYDVQLATISDALTATGVTNAVNATEQGILLGIYLRLTAAPDGSPISNLEIVIDGGSTRTIAMWNGSAVWVPAGIRLFSSDGRSGGNAVSDIAQILIGTKYKTSLRVGHNIATATSSTGALDIGVLRGVKL